MARTYRHTEDADENKNIIPDGGRVYVPMRFMDNDPGFDDVQRAIAATKQHITDVDVRRHRPGFRCADNDDGSARRQMVDAYNQSANNAWRGGEDPHGAGERAMIGQREGDLCTVNGRRGRLEYVNGKLVCMSASPADAKADAYFDYERELRDTWRGDGRKFQARDPQGREAGSWTEEEDDDDEQQRRRR